MTTTRERADPFLAALRGAARGLADDRLRNEIERARFALFGALEQGDESLARAWLAALRASVDAVSPDERVRPHLARAVDSIAALVGPPPESVSAVLRFDCERTAQLAHDILARALVADAWTIRQELVDAARERGITVPQLLGAAIAGAIFGEGG